MHQQFSSPSFSSRIDNISRLFLLSFIMVLISFLPSSYSFSSSPSFPLTLLLTKVEVISSLLPPRSKESKRKKSSMNFHYIEVPKRTFCTERKKEFSWKCCIFSFLFPLFLTSSFSLFNSSILSCSFFSYSQICINKNEKRNSKKRIHPWDQEEEVMKKCIFCL